MKTRMGAVVVVKEGSNLVLAMNRLSKTPTWGAIQGLSITLELQDQCAVRLLRSAFNLRIVRANLEYQLETQYPSDETPKELEFKLKVYVVDVPEGAAEKNAARAEKIGLLLKSVPQTHLPTLTPFDQHHRGIYQQLKLWPGPRLAAVAAA